MLSKKEVENQRLAALPKSKRDRDFERDSLIKKVNSVIYKTKLYDLPVEDLRRELKKLTS